jgi:hypothetical protein
VPAQRKPTRVPISEDGNGPFGMSHASTESVSDPAVVAAGPGFRILDPTHMQGDHDVRGFRNRLR